MREYDTTTTTIIPQSQSTGGQPYESSISILLHMVTFHSNAEYIPLCSIWSGFIPVSNNLFVDTNSGFIMTRSFPYHTNLNSKTKIY